MNVKDSNIRVFTCSSPTNNTMFDTISAELIISWVLKVGGAVVFLLAAWVFANWLRGFIRKRIQTTNFDATLGRFFASLVRIAILILAILASLNIFGVETTSFAALLAGAGLAIGLAMQGTLSNVGAGAMLLTFRPFKVGDDVQIGDTEGVVKEVGLFMTTVDTRDNCRVTIPNGEVFSAPIVNETHHPLRRVDVAVGTDYAADLDETRRVLTAAAASVEGGLEDPAPAVYLESLGDSSINWSVRVWTDSREFRPVRDRLTHAVKVHLDRAAIGIPFPQRDVHLDRVDA